MNGRFLRLEYLTSKLMQYRADDLLLSDLHPKKAFIIAALDREIRLSFAKRIRSTVPKEMHALIPERLDEDKSPDFKYDSEGEFDPPVGSVHY
jgi:hypothetical protein